SSDRYSAWTQGIKAVRITKPSRYPSRKSFPYRMCQKMDLLEITPQLRRLRPMKISHSFFVSSRSNIPLEMFTWLFESGLWSLKMEWHSESSPRENCPLLY